MIKVTNDVASRRHICLIKGTDPGKPEKHPVPAQPIATKKRLFAVGHFRSVTSPVHHRFQRSSNA
jgi:hypothetical protein